MILHSTMKTPAPSQTEEHFRVDARAIHWIYWQRCDIQE